MRGKPTRAWGKLKHDERGEVVAWHPLTDHCADVAAVAEALLERTLLRRRLARLAGLADLGRRLIARLCVLVVLHDVGKVNLGFRNKALSRPPFTAGHQAEVLALLDENTLYPTLAQRFLASLDAETLGDWGEDPEGADVFQLLVATISHHGRPVRIDDSNKLKSRDWTPEPGRDPFADVAELVACSRRWFPEAWQAGGEKLPASPEFQHAWAGLVMLADWLGSDDAPDRFPFREDGDDSDRMDFARGRAREVLERIGLDPLRARRSLGATPPGFHTIEPDPNRRPRAAQQAVLELPLDTGGSVVVLEAETGSGKTEAALVHYARLFHAGEVDGMVFALPTRTAATQIHGRICRAVAHAFPDPDCRPAVVLAVPGYLRVDDAEGHRLARFEVLWPDDDRYRHRAWAAEQPKRYLAGPVVVGTIDQVLLSALQVSHAHLRTTALLRQLLVVDEVHASDAYMTRVLEHVLDQHRQAGGHALLLSATLGAAARARLLAESDPDRRPDRLPALVDALAAPYPAISRRPVGGAIEVRAVASDGRNKAVAVTLCPEIATAQKVAQKALAAARAGAKVLVIRNTVKDCLATQGALEAVACNDEALFRCRGVVTPHHGRYAADDRKALDEAIESAFGRERPAGGRVVVATQTVEQSLDLDADLLITDLCPMDVLLQRVGRLHRHQRYGRPEAFAAPRIVVLVPADGDLGRWVSGDSREASHGLGTVYEDLRALEATWRQLRPEPTLVIPAENRRLVEESVHPQRLNAIAEELGEAWEKHQQAVFGKLIAETLQGNLNAVKRQRTFIEPEVLFADERRIPTRLGLAARRVRFEPAFRSPFGVSVRELTIPEFLAKDVPAEAELAEDVAATPDEIVFRFGPNAYRYDRLGLQREEA